MIQGSGFGVVVVVVVDVVLWGVVVELDTLLWTRSVGREAVREKDRIVRRRTFMLSLSDGCLFNSDSTFRCADVLNPIKTDKRLQFS